MTIIIIMQKIKYVNNLRGDTIRQFKAKRLLQLEKIVVWKILVLLIRRRIANFATKYANTVYSS